MSKNIIEWKWTKGENYERSRRIIKEVIDNTFTKQMEETAYESSLNHDESTWDLMNSMKNGFINVNKREDTDKKLSERQMFAQVNMNPYLISNNYVDDIGIRDNFLKPQSTTSDFSRNNEK
jgi:hypothetical protein